MNFPSTSFSREYDVLASSRGGLNGCDNEMRPVGFEGVFHGRFKGIECFDAANFSYAGGFAEFGDIEIVSARRRHAAGQLVYLIVENDVNEVLRAVPAQRSPSRSHS